MATKTITGGIRPVTPSNNIAHHGAGIVLSIGEARQIAEALISFQQLADAVGLHLIGKLEFSKAMPTLK